MSLGKIIIVYCHNRHRDKVRDILHRTFFYMHYIQDLKIRLCLSSPNIFLMDTFSCLDVTLPFHIVKVFCTFFAPTKEVIDKVDIIDPKADYILNLDMIRLQKH